MYHPFLDALLAPVDLSSASALTAMVAATRVMNILDWPAVQRVRAVWATEILGLVPSGTGQRVRLELVCGPQGAPAGVHFLDVLLHGSDVFEPFAAIIYPREGEVVKPATAALRVMAFDEDILSLDVMPVLDGFHVFCVYGDMLAVFWEQEASLRALFADGELLSARFELPAENLRMELSWTDGECDVCSSPIHPELFLCFIVQGVRMVADGFGADTGVHIWDCNTEKWYPKPGFGTARAYVTAVADERVPPINVTFLLAHLRDLQRFIVFSGDSVFAEMNLWQSLGFAWQGWRRSRTKK